MAAYTAGVMTHITCRLTAKKRDQPRNPTLGNRVWATFFNMLLMLTPSETAPPERTRKRTWNENVPKIIDMINSTINHFFKLLSAFCWFRTIAVSECCLIKLLPCILFENYIYILALEMASPGNRHCANCIGTLSFPACFYYGALISNEKGHCRETCIRHPWTMYVPAKRNK